MEKSHMRGEREVEEEEEEEEEGYNRQNSTCCSLEGT